MGDKNAEILTAVEAAALLRVSRGGLYNLVGKGDIPAIRLFGRRSLRFRKSEIERLLKSDKEVNDNAD